jgi:hypothetical protein
MAPEPTVGRPRVRETPLAFLLRAGASGGCLECPFSAAFSYSWLGRTPPVGREAPMTVRVLYYCLRAVLVYDFAHGGQF